MKKILKRTSLLLISALMSIAAAQAQKSPQDMDRFIDALMKKMTVEEKIGQLNLPVTGDRPKVATWHKRLKKDWWADSST